MLACKLEKVWKKIESFEIELSSRMYHKFCYWLNFKKMIFPLFNKFILVVFIAIYISMFSLVTWSRDFNIFVHASQLCADAAILDTFQV